MTVTGTFEVKGTFGLWNSVTYTFAEGVVQVHDAKNNVKETRNVEHIERGDVACTFYIYFHGDQMRKSLHKAKTQAQVDAWVTAVEEHLKAKGTLYTWNYGLPETDPRTSLPIVNLPPEYVEHFKHLNSAVVHWIGPVSKLGVGWKKEDRIVVLGDKCIYICRKNADITRCIAIQNISKLLLAQDNAKSLFVACLMPETVTHFDLEKGVEVKAPEYDIMFHTKDIQKVVRYIRTLYLYLTAGKNLPLEQVTSKEQLQENVRLVRPKDWKLHFCMPQKKADLAQQLTAWEEGQKGTAEGGAAPPPAPAPQDASRAAPAAAAPAAAAPAVPAAPTAAQQFLGGGAAAAAAPAAATAAAAPAAAPPAPADDGGFDEDAFQATPLGKFLVMMGLARYGKVMHDNNMDLEMLVSGLIDDSDLFHFGIESADHRRKMIGGLHNKGLIDRLTGGKAVDYNPPAIAQEQTGFGGKEIAANDDLDDLDLGDSKADASGFGGGGGGDDLDLDLDDFGALEGNGDINLDDFDLDLDVGGGAPADGGADDLDLDLDDLDLGGPAPAAGGGDDLDLDLDL